MQRQRNRGNDPASFSIPASLHRGNTFSESAFEPVDWQTASDVRGDAPRSPMRGRGYKRGASLAR